MIYLPYFGQDLESKKKVVGILAPASHSQKRYCFEICMLVYGKKLRNMHSGVVINLQFFIYLHSFLKKKEFCVGKSKKGMYPKL